jgi:hypothetical protein
MVWVTKTQYRRQYTLDDSDLRILVIFLDELLELTPVGQISDIVTHAYSSNKTLPALFMGQLMQQCEF